MAGSTRLAKTPGMRGSFGYRMRERIDTNLIINKLQAHVEGREEMTQTQINAARILLDRTVPALKPVEYQGDAGLKDVTALPLHEILQSIEGNAHRLNVEQEEVDYVEAD